MKKMIATLLVLASTAFTDTDEIVKPTPKNHRFYIEPDISFGIIGEKQSDLAVWKSQSQQYGIKVGYEYFKADNIYTELNGLRSLGSVRTKVKNVYGETFSYEGGAARDNLSGHLGYAFQYKKLTYAPFSGFGWSSWYENGYVSGFTYIPFGIKAQYPILESVVYIGFKCERLRYIHFWNKSQYSKKSGNIWSANTGGYEISLPISFFGNGNQSGWYTSVEPYFLKLYNDLSIVGGRFAAARQF